MFGGLFIVSLISTAVQGVKDAFAPTIPAENWANKESYYQDLANGVPVDQLVNNVKNGKYKVVDKHPKPHRDPKTGKIIIENYLLYKEDLKKYGAYQTYKWVEQGKYNLEGAALKKEQERIKKLYGLK